MPILLHPTRTETDLDHILAWFNAVEAEPTSREQYLRWYTDMPAGRFSRRQTAVNEQGEPVGYSMFEHQTWYTAGQYYLWVVVDPAWRRQGIGSLLYQDALDFAQSIHAVELKSEVRDNDLVGRCFAEQRGFHVTGHQYESVLDLDVFDETPYLDLLAALENQGIRFFPLSDYPNQDEGRRKLYDVNKETGLAIPGGDQSWIPFDEFVQYVCEADWFKPQGQLIAADGDAWVGLGAVRLYPAEQFAYNLITGVRKPYTGRKIAQALKILGIRYARAHGARQMRTHNASINVPMLAINRKLGYMPQPGKYILKAALKPGNTPLATL